MKATIIGRKLLMTAIGIMMAASVLAGGEESGLPKREDIKPEYKWKLEEI